MLSSQSFTVGLTWPMEDGEDPMIETLPNWRQSCIPHRDIREERVSEALFAVNLSRAIAEKHE